ncbi:MAG: DUF6691 family protein, partial [Pirellulaceae bacterium]
MDDYIRTSTPSPTDAPQAGYERPVEQKRDIDDSAERVAPQRWPWISISGSQVMQTIIFGLAFGFLLQKGGVAKFDILVGVLLLENFVVVQVMLSAIIVGMVGVYFLERANVLELQIKETAYGSNIVGGLIFGVGFGLIAYCPGTNAAAVGQGNLDALVGIVGMVFGSYLFALSSKYTTGRL